MITYLVIIFFHDSVIIDKKFFSFMYFFFVQKQAFTMKQYQNLAVVELNLDGSLKVKELLQHVVGPLLSRS